MADNEAHDKGEACPVMVIMMNGESRKKSARLRKRTGEGGRAS